MSDPVWLDRAVIVAVHGEQLAEHGGSAGIRDAGLLGSALARAANQLAYGQPDIPALAAAYGFGIARNHPFIDGNKRTAFAALFLFLALNGLEFEPGEVDATMAMLQLASGDIADDDFIAWVRSHAVEPG